MGTAQRIKHLETEVANLQQQMALLIQALAQSEAKLDAANRRIAELEQQLAAKQQRIEELEQKLLVKQQRIEELERTLNLNSSNSSKPPSSDGLHKKPAPQSLRESGKKPFGGQKGHRGATLEYAANPDKIISIPVNLCPKCGKPLFDVQAQEISRHQVVDVEIKRSVVEYQAEVKSCTCGCRAVAPLPEHTQAPVQYSPKLKALAIYLSQQFIPQKRLAQLFADVFGVPISETSLMAFEATCSKNLEPTVAQIRTELCLAPVKNADETGMRIGGKLHWMQVLSTQLLTHFRITAKRGDIQRDIIGRLVHDHFKPYFKIEGIEHALCNAHHLRELKALQEIEKEPWATQMAKLLNVVCRITKRLHVPSPDLVARIVARYRAIVFAGIAYHEAMEPLKTSSGRGRKKRRTGHNLLLRLHNFEDATLACLYDPSVPFSNNQAEQDLRMIKTKQKVSGGFRTGGGAERFAIIRSYLSTKRKQRQNLLDAIIAAFPCQEAHPHPV